MFKYFLRLLHPFAPFLTSFLYKKIYSESILFSERDGTLLEELVKCLKINNLKKKEKHLVLHRNSAVMSLFYRLLRRVREFKNKYSLQKEGLIVCLVLLPMTNVVENKTTYLTDDESYKGVDFEDVKEKFNMWLKKLVNTELNYIFLSKEGKMDERERKKKKLEEERSVFCWKEKLTLAEGRLEIFVSQKLFSRLEGKVENNQQREIRETKLCLEQEIARCEKLLSNENFIHKAPRELVEKETEKLKKLQDYYDNLKWKC